MDFREIIASNGQIIIVDPDDYENLVKYNWHVKTNGYAVMNYGGSLRLQKLMHRVILNLTDKSIFADHINRNKLDNRKINLRTANHKQNGANRSAQKGGTSKYLGVSWFKRDKKWISHIKINGKNKHLGVFLNEEEAAMAYNKAAAQQYGEYANLNPV